MAVVRVFAVKGMPAGVRITDPCVPWWVPRTYAHLVVDGFCLDHGNCWRCSRVDFPVPGYASTYVMHGVQGQVAVYGWVDEVASTTNPRHSDHQHHYIAMDVAVTSVMFEQLADHMSIDDPEVRVTGGAVRVDVPCGSLDSPKEPACLTQSPRSAPTVAGTPSRSRGPPMRAPRPARPPPTRPSVPPTTKTIS